MPGDFVVRDTDSGEIVDVVHLSDEVYSPPTVREVVTYRPPFFADDPSISTESVRRQLHIWELEDAMEWDRSPCLFFNSLEAEPPTEDQLRQTLQRREAAAARALTVAQRARDRSVAIVMFAMISILAIILTMIGMLVFH